MEFESVNNALKEFDKLSKTYMAYMHAQGILELDAATAAPVGSWEGRGVTAGILSELMYNLIADPKNEKLIAYLNKHADQLNEIQLREVEILNNKFQKMKRIPEEEYVAFTILCNDAQANWENAKKNNDFSIFQPFLEKIVTYQRKFAGYYNADLPPYDALLNEYEEGMTMAVLDDFFSQLRTVIVPLVEKIRSQPEQIGSFAKKNLIPLTYSASSPLS